MDYQASKSGCKEIIPKTLWFRKVAVTIVVTASSLFPVVAQTTTNPLSDTVTITASILATQSNTLTQPLPVSPQGPVNMTNVIDVAIFRGVAYPGSSISLLRNGEIITTVPTYQDGSFDLRLRDVSAGTYSFGIRAEDKNHLISSIVLFTIYITPGVATIVDGIIIPPTITTDKIEVKKGLPVVISGSARPSSEVRLSLLAASSFLKKIEVNASGTWSYLLDTALFEGGDYATKARTLTASSLSLFSDTVTFTIGDTERLRKKVLLAGFRKRCDLNDDSRVNLLDFSIMAFWYKRLGFPLKVDLNSDQTINLTDLSILAYCWTG